MLRRTSFAIAAVTLVLVAGAPHALGATGYAGMTEQGEDITIRLDPTGAVERVAYGWDMACRGGGSLTDGGTISRPRRSNATSFSARGGYTAPIERKFEGLFKVRISGERVSPTRFRGTLKVRAKVIRERTGEPVARCSTGRLGWFADLKAPAPPARTPATASPSLSLR